MLRDLLTQKCAQKKVTAFGYPRACRLRKHQIENRSPDLPLPTKRDLKCIKLAKIGKKSTKNGIFRFFEKVSFFYCIHSYFCPFKPYFMNINHILKKVGIFNLMFSESTCSGVSKIRNQKKLRALLG
jgi:hypothetical protein